MNCYHHFTIEERACLRKYYVEGKSYREIARLLGRNVSYGSFGACKTSACFATLAERKTRFYIAIKIPDRKGSTLAKAVIAALSQLPKGSEFANW